MGIRKKPDSNNNKKQEESKVNQKELKYGDGIKNEHYIAKPWHVNEATVCDLIPPDSYIEEYIKYASCATDAPLWYHVGCILTTIATASGFKDLRVAGSKPGTYANVPVQLWSTLVGSSGDRKSAAIAPARRLLHNVNPKSLLPKDGTQEAWHDRLASEEVNGVAILLRDEFSGLFDHANKSYGGGILSWLLDTHQGYASRETKTGSFVNIPRARMNLLGGIPPNTLREKTNQSIWESGFMPRLILWAAGRERYLKRYFDDPKKEMELAKYAKALVRNTRPVIIEAAQADQFSDWIYDNVEAKLQVLPGALVSTFQRLQEKGYVIAAALAVANQSTLKTSSIYVSDEDVMYTLKILKAIMQSTGAIFSVIGVSTEASDENIVIEVVKENPGITMQDLITACSFSRSKLYRIVKTLREGADPTIKCQSNVKSGGNKIRGSIGHFMAEYTFAKCLK